MAKLDENLRQLMDQDFVDKWTAIRAAGRTRFALTRGALLWGGLMTLGMSLGHWLSGHWHIAVFTFLIVFLPVGGFFVGCSIWKHNEKRFAETKRRIDGRPTMCGR